MKTLYDVKQFIKDNYGKDVIIKIKGLRNKNEEFYGTITECYNRVFIVSNDLYKNCYSYGDILLGNILVFIR